MMKAIRNPQSAIRNPQSAIRNPQSAIRNPQSAIRNPQLAIVLFLALSFTFFQCAEDTSKDTPKDLPTYTVTFNTNGGNTIVNRTVTKDEKVAKPTDPTRDGFTFVDWYTDEATTLAYDFTTPVTANLTLYAKWAADAVETFTVIFNTNGGNTIANRTVNKDEKVAKPTDPTRDGFTFVDWYSDEATTLAYDFATPVTANFTLYAKWTKDALTLANDIVFASLTDADKTVIGMREFLLTVTYNGLAAGVKDSLAFMIGESAEAPAWDDIKDNNALRTRAFSPESDTRRIYFSISPTGRQNNAAIDLNSGDEKAIIDASGTGVMSPNTSYYIHVYAGGVYQKTSEPITTQNYPAMGDYPTNAIAGGASVLPAFWGMDPWLKNGKLIELELKTEEFNYLPFRFIPLFDISCAAITSLTMVANLSNRDTYSFLTLSYPVAANHMAGEHNEVLLRASPQAPAGYYELIAAWQRSEILTFTTSANTDCVPTPGSENSFADMSAFDRTLTVVAE